MKKIIRRSHAFVRVPASTSNLGPGFDMLGLSLELVNEIEIEAGGHGPDSIEITGEGEKSLPRGAANLVLQSARKLLPKSSCPEALKLKMTNRIPLARGLGSSAAARLGGLAAAHALLAEDPFAKDEALLRAACELEGHPDNVVAAFYGGLRVVVPANEKCVSFAVSVPKDLCAVVCVPDFELATEKARQALPAKVPLADAVATAARVAWLLRAIESRRFEWLRPAMEDVLHQPYRAKLVPGMDAVIAEALKAGAYGAALSGAGPSMLALGPRQRLSGIGRAMEAAWAAKRIQSKALAMEIDRQGLTIRL